MTLPAPIVCIGEMLWDVLPTGRQPGGAPLSAALYLHRPGPPVQRTRRVGNGEPGREPLAFGAHQGLATQLIQPSPAHLTGVMNTLLRCPGAAHTVLPGIGRSNALRGGLRTGLLAGHAPAHCLREASAAARAHIRFSDHLGRSAAATPADSLPAP
ncbi:carbohydrate kinase family protein [Hymenobacter rubidus]|uniref:hypothetical protein n=1 Tax=Hymenobacter rubidus TaxID=1441626 RepID=UPI00191E8A75|nr:hypothetical protein [Hymenobacter rubidus]